ncbi:UbiX family flavin prenyltransferase [Rhizobiales bacterium RZME27]|uniref:Flavin prenyltransferase UbiX n=1 Tax=Endobacterium cereale TaxID=2663029 RepID=A0A6A8ABE1_9HYPH|nr:UbiX family flavin prenyltransferase [Endobacterium cereale]MEB2844200.1 UbiX family flavin prenyltransferase [Endobacterium cereale]MQY48613.1 UbiX family flavin prenyltransferase [Endobacterium cereale]
MSEPKKRVVLGVSGASGAAIALRIGELLARLPTVELHLVVSEAATRTFLQEVGPDALVRLIDLCHHHHPIEDIGASIASGSFRTAGMIVAPCSMRTLAGIASGLSDNLLIRAADVHLKERRPLILLTRETPLHLGHLRNMVSVTEMGATVMPPVPAFYHRPQSVGDIVDHIARRAIDMLRLEELLLAREWQG